MAYKDPNKAKEYRKQYRATHKEYLKELNKNYYESHKEKYQKRYQQTKEKYKENYKENNKKWRERNKEKYEDYHKKYYEDNKEKYKETQKQYYIDNREKYRQYCRDHLKEAIERQLRINDESRLTAHNHKQLWEPEEIEMLIHMKKQGKSHKEIATCLGRTIVSINNRVRLLRKNGDPFNGNPIDI